jgi:hypothetical protein
LFAQAKTFLGWLLDHFAYLGSLLGLIGGYYNYRQNQKLFWFFLIIFLFTGPFFVFLSHYPLDNTYYYPYCSSMLSRFMLPAELVFAIWIGFGAAALLSLAPNKLFIFSAYCLLLAVPFLSLSLHYARADKSRFYFIDDLARNILLSVKPGGLIFCSADNTLFSLWYLQGVEGQRPDVTIISTTPHRWRAHQLIARHPELFTAGSKSVEAYSSGLDFLAAVIKNNLGRFPIYSDLSDTRELRPFFARLAPSGLIYQLLPDSSPRAKLACLTANYPLWDKYRFRSPLSGADLDDYFQLEVVALYAEAHNFSGVTFALNHQYRAAQKEFNLALALDPHLASAAFNRRKLKNLL